MLTVVLFIAWPVVVFGVLQVRSVRFVGEILLAAAFAVVFSSAMVMRYLRGQVVPLVRGSDLARAVEDVMILAGIRRHPDVGLVRSPGATALIVGGVAGRPLLIVTTGLVERLTRPQLRAVLAHEAAHLDGPDQPTRMIGVALTNWLVWLVTPRLEVRRVIAAAAIALVAVASPPIAIAMFGGPLAIAFVETRISRQREHIADARAVLMTREPAALADALEALDGDVAPLAWTVADGAAPRPAWIVGALATARVRTDVPEWIHRLFDPHPALAERIRRVRAMN